MCDRMEILHHGMHGYVARCCSCARFQLAFGTTLMSFEEAGLRALAADVRDNREVFRDRICIGEKAFLFDADTPSMRLLLCYAELEQLDDLLSEALWMHGVLELISGG